MFCAWVCGCWAGSKHTKTLRPAEATFGAGSAPALASIVLFCFVVFFSCFLCFVEARNPLHPHPLQLDEKLSQQQITHASRGPPNPAIGAIVKNHVKARFGAGSVPDPAVWELDPVMLVLDPAVLVLDPVMLVLDPERSTMGHEHVFINVRFEFVRNRVNMAFV